MYDLSPRKLSLLCGANVLKLRAKASNFRTDTPNLFLYSVGVVNLCHYILMQKEATEKNN